MGVSQPDKVIERFAELFNTGDLDGLLNELYEDDIVLLPGPGEQPVASKDAVRAVLKQFLALGGTMSILGATAIPNGDVALTHSKWRLTLPEGDPMEATTAEVVRRAGDGTWRYLIDNPFGGAVLDAV